MSFSESGFAQFMASAAGRIVRIIAGALILYWGYTKWGTAAGTILVIIGLIPFLAGVFDVCVITALAGGPFVGRKIRALKR